MSRELYQRIYLSPHLDDAVLSCGGTIYQQRRARLSVLVVTLMAGDATPEAADTPYVTGLHTRWGLSATSNPSVARRAEDREALDILQADALHWEWPDCIYRRHVESGEFLYHSEEALFGQVHPTEQAMVAQLAQRLSGLPLAPGGRVYAPLNLKLKMADPVITFKDLGIGNCQPDGQDVASRCACDTFFQPGPG